MVVLYAISIIGFGYWIKGLKASNGSQESQEKVSILKTSLGVLILLLGILLPILLPVPKTPEPTGPFKVGTFTLMVEDETRFEIYSDVEDEPRRLMVQFWYPADPISDSKPDVWMENIDVIGPAIAGYLGLPSFFLDHIQYSHAHSYPEAPLSRVQERYPLLLFSHGWNGFRAQNTYQVEELASHGYIVAAPDHAYGAIASIFPDGDVVYNNPLALPSGMNLPEDEFMRATNLLGQQWARDLGFIVDILGKSNSVKASDITSDRIDFEQIGVFGHSTGGGAAIQFCGQDSRCKAVIGMDPYLDPVSPQLLGAGLNSPMLAIFSQTWFDRGGKNDLQFNELDSHSSGGVHRFWIKGTTHYDFSDLPAFSPLAHTLGLKGEINGQRALGIINDFSLDFFNHYLMNEKMILLVERSDEYPEVIIYK
jgi:pimeloyl-ACP methyl ester carboxylesterase